MVQTWQDPRRPGRTGGADERTGAVGGPRSSGVGPGDLADEAPYDAPSAAPPVAPAGSREDPPPADQGGSGTDESDKTDESGEADEADEAPHGARRGRQRDFGPLGLPLNRQSPFYVGFVGAIGVFVAYELWRIVSSLGTVFTLIAVAFFLTLSLDPLVQVLVRRGLRRGLSVSVVFALVVLVFGLIGLVVVPPVSQQATELVNRAPSLVNDVLNASWVRDLDRNYQVLSRLQTEFNARITDSGFLTQVAGGLLGAGQLIASGVFSSLTVLVLTLYFLASLPALKQAAYAVVPATRRPRVISLSEEIMRRVGSYAISQVAVAAFNAFCSYIMMSLVGIPYAAVLAVGVGVLGLVPMVGATLGASLVAFVALFDDPTHAIIAIVYFVVYQQLENYLLAPRIMQRTVSVPGAVTVVSALAGGALLGMVGALIAIPTAAGLLLLYDEVLVPRQRGH